jgi:hypothetical protein
MTAPIRYAGPSSLPYILLFPHFLHVLFLCIFRLFFHIYGDLAVMVMQRSCLYCYIYDFDIDLASFFLLNLVGRSSQKYHTHPLELH